MAHFPFTNIPIGQKRNMDGFYGDGYGYTPWEVPVNFPIRWRQQPSGSHNDEISYHFPKATSEKAYWYNNVYYGNRVPISGPVPGVNQRLWLTPHNHEVIPGNQLTGGRVPYGMMNVPQSAGILGTLQNIYASVTGQG